MDANKETLSELLALGDVAEGTDAGAALGKAALLQSSADVVLVSEQWRGQETLATLTSVFEVLLSGESDYEEKCTAIEPHLADFCGHLATSSIKQLRHSQ